MSGTQIVRSASPTYSQETIVPQAAQEATSRSIEESSFVVTQQPRRSSDPIRVAWGPVEALAVSVAAPSNVDADTALHEAFLTQLTCPLSKTLIQDPITATDGFTYDKTAFNAWLADKGNISPKTGKPLSGTGNAAQPWYYSNILLKNMVSEYQAKSPSEQATWVPRREDLKCAVSLSGFQDPVLVSSGKSYELASAQRWLEDHQTDPETRAVLVRCVIRCAALKVLSDIAHGDSTSLISMPPVPPPPMNPKELSRAFKISFCIATPTVGSGLGTCFTYCFINASSAMGLGLGAMTGGIIGCLALGAAELAQRYQPTAEVHPAALLILPASA